MDTTPLKSVLVTGATGFIGTRLVRRLIERGCQVTCLVRENSHIDELRSLGAQLKTGDVVDRGSVKRALAGSQADTVFHLAGLVKAKCGEAFARVNVGGVETVAAVCADHEGLPKPPVLIVVSSLSASGPSAADRFRVEGDPATPVSSYGRSKLAGEQAAAKWADMVPISIVRPPIVFGPGDRVSLDVFQSIARWGLHVVPGMRDHCYSLVHVDDLVEGLLLAAEKGERLCERESLGHGSYFISDEGHPSYAQIGQAIATALSKKPPTVLRLPGPVISLVACMADAMSWVCRRSPHERGLLSRDKIIESLAGSWTCESAKVRAQLGWFPAVSLADRLHETAQWYRDAGWI